MNNTRETQEQKSLGIISKQRAEKLVTTWANLRPWGYPTPAGYWTKVRDESIKRMRAYRDVFALPRDEDVEALIVDVSTWLQRAWHAPNARIREWSVFMARLEYVQVHQRPRNARYASEEVAVLSKHVWKHTEPQLTPFEAAMFHLQSNAHRMQHCPNPGCRHPYFLKPEGKKVQKFCSPECANPSRQESKRRWWTNNRGK